MKNYLITVIVLLVTSRCFAQGARRVAKLKQALQIATTDTARARIMSELCFAYNYSLNPDSALRYAAPTFQLSHNTHFVAVSERQKFESDDLVTVIAPATRKKNDQVVITVIGNANGIPQKLKDKIFQPFFAAGSTIIGTGLGWSLSDDIVTKAHNGTIKLQSAAADGTGFKIYLPLKETL